MDHTPSQKTWRVPLRGSDSSVQYFKTGKFLKKKKKNSDLVARLTWEKKMNHIAVQMNKFIMLLVLLDLLEPQTLSENGKDIIL